MYVANGEKFKYCENNFEEEKISEEHSLSNWPGVRKEAGKTEPFSLVSHNICEIKLNSETVFYSILNGKLVKYLFSRLCKAVNVKNLLANKTVGGR